MSPGALTDGRHYLDHASTSPLRPGVAEAMAPWLGAADPGRVHTEGRMARAALEDARDRIASALGCRASREVVLTSGATEAVAMATWGAIRRTPAGPVVAAAVEHSCVREWAARAGGGVVEPPVDAAARISLEGVDLRGAALVNVQWGNHEVGTRQPVGEVVAAARGAGALVHVDAAQAAGRVAIDFAALGADLVSVSAHKLGGPRGVGALLVRRGLRVEPLLVGGAQERMRRAGLEYVAGAVGFAAALDGVDPVAEGARQDQLTQRLLREAASAPGVIRFTPEERLPHIACFGLEAIEAEPVLLGLDQAGIAVHSGSSCSSELLEPSAVLEAMGVDGDRSLRVSVGWSTTDDDVTTFLTALPQVLAALGSLRT
ncbi:MAG: Cysteine desulfurase [uncultured Acidimicrobiales bacterium]|uniref:Cysteine desulfurase n=1 Tax=uncultured Acidimicrobiales bacterium TaxID=310071 RepID=A0A6J4J438_9ACTN|nr:MAG: Cysteine desulfurase [uncultured Acidimicrobiales bacterium]